VSTWKILQPLFKLMQPVRWLLVGAVLLAAATVLANVGLLATSAVLISLAALQPPLLDLMVFIVGVRFFGISRAVLRYSERYLSHKITFQILTQLRLAVYRRIEPVAPAGLQQYSQGQLFDRVLNDIEVLKYFYLRALLTPATALVVLVICSAVLMQFQVEAAVLLMALFLMFGLGLPFGLRYLSKDKTARMAEAREQWQTLLEDYLGGMAELQSDMQKQNYRQRLTGQMAQMMKLERWLSLCGNVTGNVISYGSNLSLVLALLIVIPAVGQGSLPGVYCAMVLLIIWSSFEAIQPFPQALLQLQQSVEAARHLADLPQIAQLPTRKTQHPKQLDLCFSQVGFAYPGGPQIYQNLNLTCPQGAHIALVGSSGSGKSTLAALLVRFWEPQQGTILLGGIPLAHYPEAQLRSFICLVEQDTFLFSATLAENLRLAAPEADEAQLWQALRFALLDDVVAALPQGLDTNLGDNGFRLSGGQRQRLALARLWLRNCPIVVLDELFQGLDTLTAQTLRQHLAEWGKGRTIITITHSLQHLQTMDCVYVLQQGQVVEQGTVDALLKNQNGFFYQMWRLEREQLTVLLAE